MTNTEEAAAAAAATGVYESSLMMPPLDDALVSFILALMNRFLAQVHTLEETNDDPTPPLLNDIYKVAGKILYYVSASNWSFYYVKIKSAVQVLGSIGEGVEMNPPDIRMLEHGCLTRQRLHTVLTGKGREGERLYACLYNVCMARLT